MIGVFSYALNRKVNENTDKYVLKRKYSEAELRFLHSAFFLKFLTIANSFLLNIAEHENFSANKYENANYCWHFHIYKQKKFHAQLS